MDNYQPICCGNYEVAVKEFKRSSGLGRNSSYGATAAQYLAMSYLQLDDTENAIKAFKSAFQIDPYRDDIRVKLGNLYFSQGKYEEARAEYADAVRLNPSTVNRYSLGQAHIELRRFSEAEAQYNEIQCLAPQEAADKPPFLNTFDSCFKNMRYSADRSTSTFS